MKWISSFQLFLFDFDGLLVNTEELHYRAYQNMCKNRGVPLPWDFNRYCQAAHYRSDALRSEILEACPALKIQEPNWEILYQEKQQEVQRLLKNGVIHLMPGAYTLLSILNERKIPRAVVTNSSDDLVSIIRSKNPILDTIPHWITRHYYTHPKPNPECYLKAIELLAKPQDNIIGFEDSPRGLNALLQTPAKPVLVCEADYPEIPGYVKKGVLHAKTLEDILKMPSLP